MTSRETPLPQEAAHRSGTAADIEDEAPGQALDHGVEHGPVERQTFEVVGESLEVLAGHGVIGGAHGAR